MIQPMLQARVSKTKCETVTDVIRVVEGRMKDLQATQEEERKQKVVKERWHETRRRSKQEHVVANLRRASQRYTIRSEIFSSSKSPARNIDGKSLLKERQQGLVRKAALSYMRPAVVEAPPPPWSAHMMQEWKRSAGD